MKKFLSLALALAMLISASALTACGGDSTNTTAASNNSQAPASSDNSSSSDDSANTDAASDDASTTAATDPEAAPSTPATGGDVIIDDPFDSLFHEYSEVENLDEFKNGKTNLMEEYYDNMVAELSIFSGFDYTGEGNEALPEFGQNEGAQNLFDMNEQTKWCSSKNAVEGVSAIVWSMTEAVDVAGYVITTGNDNVSYPGRNPTRWRLYAANELPTVRMDEVVNEETGETYFDLQYEGVVPEGWTLIDGVNAEDPLDPTLSLLPDVNWTEFGFEIANPGSYQYFMLLIDYCSTDVSFQMADFSLYGTVE